MNVSEQSPFFRRTSRSMIVCSCNVLSDQDVLSAISADAPPRTTSQIYQCLGCSAQCGRCARTLRRIMDEALGACALGCCRCPHKHEHSEARSL